MNTISIYALVDPRDKGTYRYIGVTSKKLRERLLQHVASSKSKRTYKNKRYQWIRSLLSESVFPEIVLLETCSELDAEQREGYFISQFRGSSQLLNHHSRSVYSSVPIGRAEIVRRLEAKKADDFMKSKWPALYRRQQAAAALPGRTTQTVE